METCPDCGCKVYGLGCVNCNEIAYIEEQCLYDADDLRVVAAVMSTAQPKPARPAEDERSAVTPEQLKILAGAVKPNGDLRGNVSDFFNYLTFNPGATTATLDGDFTAEQLEAIAAWMKEKKGIR